MVWKSLHFYFLFFFGGGGGFKLINGVILICIVKKHLGGHIAAVSAKYLFFTCEQDHKTIFSCRSRKCLQSEHTSKIHSDFMEKCWFSSNDCIWLFSTLLTLGVGCEAWKVVGRSFLLDCSTLKPSAFHIFHKVFIHLVLVIVIHQAWETITHIKVYAMSNGTIKMWRVWRKFQGQITQCLSCPQNVLLLLWIQYMVFLLGFEQKKCKKKIWNIAISSLCRAVSWDLGAFGWFFLSTGHWNI